MEKVISMFEYIHKRKLKENIEELDVKVCTYNFLKKLKINKLSDLHNINWQELVQGNKNEVHIITDLEGFLSFSKEA